MGSCFSPIKYVLQIIYHYIISYLNTNAFKTASAAIIINHNRKILNPFDIFGIFITKFRSCFSTGQIYVWILERHIRKLL